MSPMMPLSLTKTRTTTRVQADRRVRSRGGLESVFRGVGLGLLLAAGQSAYALSPQPLNREGPIDFIPTIKLSQGYDDNTNQGPSGEAESSTVTKVAPSFLFRARERANRYQFRYTPEFRYYGGDDDQDDRVNHNAAVRTRTVIDARNRLSTSLTATRNQQTLSSTNREAEDEDEGDINERYELAGTYTFGARTAQGGIEMDAGYLWNRFANNLTTDSNNRSEEYDSPRAGATFLWRVAPKTRVLVEGRYQDFDYQWQESDLDSTNIAGRVGVTWVATAKTTGSVRVGRLRKAFEAGDKEDEEITSWQARVTWKPARHSSFRFETANSLEEGSQTVAGASFEDTIEQTRYAVAWQHAWDSQLTSTITYSLRDKDYIGGSSEGRDDELTTVSIGLNYAFRRWMDLGLETRLKDNDSSTPNNRYDRGSVFLTLTLSL